MISEQAPQIASAAATTPARVVIDTNISIYLGEGTMQPSDVLKPGEKLVTPNAVLLELLATWNHASAKQKIGALKAIVRHSDEMLPDPEQWLATKLGYPLQGELADWNQNMDALKGVYAYEDITQKLCTLVPRANGIGKYTRRFDVRAVCQWNKEHEERWVKQLINMLRGSLPSIDTWIANDKQGKRPRLSAAQRQHVDNYLTSTISSQSIARALLERIGAPDNLVASAVSGPLAPYIGVYKQYVGEILTERRMPQGNDLWDSEFLLYVNKPDIIFVTGESKWERLAKEAGFGWAVRRIDPKPFIAAAQVRRAGTTQS